MTLQPVFCDIKTKRAVNAQFFRRGNMYRKDFNDRLYIDIIILEFSHLVVRVQTFFKTWPL